MMKRNLLQAAVLLCFLSGIGICKAESLSLAGKWGVRLDPGKGGVAEKWFDRTYETPIDLPGSLDEAGVSPKSEERVLDRLSRDHRYIGVAWYGRTVRIPEAWRGQRLELFLERVMWRTQVWLDGREVGTQDSLCTPHIYSLGLVEPGDHCLSIRVDNAGQYNLGYNSHGYSEGIQTLWNGLTGRLELRAAPLVRVGDIQVFPDIAKKKIKVLVAVANEAGATGEGKLELTATVNGRPPVRKSFPVKWTAPDSMIEQELELGADAKLWDEFEPNIYTLETRLESAAGVDSRTVTFGLREISTDKWYGGRQFLVNGRPTLMRCTHDAGSFPLTGYPSSRVEDWLRICRIVKAYGLNHMRFHSWCPPEAAFIAADQVGIYLQPELPLFSNTSPALGLDAARDAFLEREFRRILKAYGNHPSFCLMAMGNELFGDITVVDAFVREGYKTDPRRLYTATSNPSAQSITTPGATWSDPPYIRPRTGEKFFVGHSWGKDGGYYERRVSPWEPFNRIDGETVGDYVISLPDVGAPVISHEVGQHFMFPNLAEIPKYTGVQKARNYELWQELVRKNGWLERAPEIIRASGKFSLLFYRDQVERQLRTSGYGGFQLLDLHDFPGQGSATVGILDAFWDSKGLITPEEWSRFCGPTVLLARLPKRIWAPGEKFEADVDLAHYGPVDLKDVAMTWRLGDSDGKTLAQGELKTGAAKTGGLTRIGRVAMELPKTERAAKWNLEVTLPGQKIANDWSLWVYPPVEPKAPQDVLVTDNWPAARERLEAGGKVLWLTQGALGAGAIRNNIWPVSFAPPFWSASWGATVNRFCGLFINKNHPALAGFPTEEYADWQWKPLVEDAVRMSFTELPASIEPLVWVIDSPLFGHRQAALFEARYGNGRLVTCSFNLKGDLKGRPVAATFLQNLLGYMAGGKFQPAHDLGGQDLSALLFPYPTGAVNRNQGIVVNASGHTPLTVDEQTIMLGPAAVQARIKQGDSDGWKAIDNVWWTAWEVKTDVPYPHELVLRFPQPVAMRGCRLMLPGHESEPNADRIKDFAVYVSNDGVNWGEPVAKGTVPPDRVLYRVGFAKPVSAAHVKLVVLSAYRQGSSTKVVEFDIEKDGGF